MEIFMKGKAAIIPDKKQPIEEKSEAHLSFKPEWDWLVKEGKLAHFFGGIYEGEESASLDKKHMREVQSTLVFQIKG